MSELDACRHCGYRQPTDAATCPGCGRAHPVIRREAPRRLPALAAHLGLVGPAKRSRWMLVATGWLAAAFALAATARFAMSFEEVAKELADTTPARITDVARTLGWVTVVTALVTIGVLGDWVRRTLHNLTGLHLDDTWRSAWSLGGWAMPGETALRARRQVDLQWRDTSTAVAPLPATSHGRGWTRLPVSQVVVRWWGMWLAVPAGVAILVVLLGDSFETSSIGRELALTALAAAALLVVALRSAYDVIGIVSVAQAHRAEALLRERDDALRAGTARPKPEPLVVVDHELEAAGLTPAPRRIHPAAAPAPSLTVTDAALADYLHDDGSDVDDELEDGEVEPIGATTDHDEDAELDEDRDADADAGPDAAEDVYDLSTYFAR